jgi:cell division protein FtsA
MALHTPLQTAEKVKIRHGNLLESSSESIELPVIGDEENRNTISLEVVHSVILARVEEALMILAKSLDKSALREQIGAGIVLTGGLTKLKGIRELAQAIFHGMPVRIGLPRELGGMYEDLKDPAYSTVVGLILYQAGEHTQYEIDYSKRLLHHKEENAPDVTDIRNLEPETAGKEAVRPTRRRKVREEKFDLELPDNKGKKKENEEDDSLLPSNFKKRDGNPFSKFVNWAKQLF